MNIRDRENSLFDRWRNKNKSVGGSFMIDGCPNPATYEQEGRKVVFVLKDGNMGEDGKPGDDYDQRDELEKEPTAWWGVIARWCFFIRLPSASWSDALRSIDSTESVKDALSRHCFIQLKKTWGFGSVSNDELRRAVQNDRDEILEQLAIYLPDFIICCGNGDYLRAAFNCDPSDRNVTVDGVGFWRVQVGERQSVLVDYCHPSIRIGTKVNGMVARGLSSALTEIAGSVPHQ